MFGKNSARVVITGFRPDLPANVAGAPAAACTDLVVLGQVVDLSRTQDGRPFLKRRTLKRGVIHDVCETGIRFVETKKTYDFFADDGSALTLREDDVSPPPTPEAEAAHPLDDEIELDENLTGKDLLQLNRRNRDRSSSSERPANAAFDSTELKEGSYFVCRRRLKAALVSKQGLQRVAASPSAPAAGQEISILAGTLGRIEKSAGFRSEPLWVAQILPDSAPLPFLQSLISLPRNIGGPRDPAPPQEVILAAGDLMEINQFLDHSRTECTHLGEALEPTSTALGLPSLYSRPVLPLDENLILAERSGVLAAVQKAARGLRLVFKNPETAAQRRILLIDEAAPRAIDGNAVGDLWRRQCFLGMDRLDSPSDHPRERASRPSLSVAGIDIKVFRPKDWSQVSPDYYAIDLELDLRPNFSSKDAPLVCRFPLASIDLTLLDMAQDILSTAFEIHREAPDLWRKD